MSAVDSSGNNLIEYRAVRSKLGVRLFEYQAVEAIVTPIGLTIPNIQLLVAVSASLLSQYFFYGGGGA